MLYPLHLLVTDADTGANSRIETLPQRAWRPMLLVPRHLCLFESLPCREVRWYELAGFVRLQVLRLSPFSNPDASAVLRGGRLMLWLWDADEIGAAVAAAGLQSLQLRPVAESLYLQAPIEHGGTIVRGTQSDDCVNCEFGALTQSETSERHALDLSVVHSKPWAHNWAPPRVASGDELHSEIRLRQLTNLAAVTFCASMLALMMFHWGAVTRYQSNASTLEGQMEADLRKRGELSAMSKAIQEDEHWVSSYLSATRQLDLQSFLDAVRPLLEQHGVVIREIEVSAGNVSMMLATAGGEIRLPQLLSDLRSLSGISDVQLLQHSELSLATFSLQADGYYLRPGIEAHSAALASSTVEGSNDAKK